MTAFLKAAAALADRLRARKQLLLVNSGPVVILVAEIYSQADRFAMENWQRQMLPHSDLRGPVNEIAHRLAIWERMQVRVREIEDESITLAHEEIWEPEDESAINRYEAAAAIVAGLQPLFREEIA